MIEAFHLPDSSWKDVREDGHAYDWLVPGIWRVTPPGMRPRGWLHDEIRRPPAVSFRRYAGTAFETPDGELPLRYRVALTVTPLDAHPQSNPPVGDLGIPFYYLDPLHYVEAVLRTDRVEIWACDGGMPLRWKGWHPLFQHALKTAGGQSRRVVADVDAQAGTLTLAVDDEVVATVRHGLLQPYSHYLALRATGNRVIYSDLRIEGE